MKFRTLVEPPEPMRGLEVPMKLADALGGGKRPAVTVTINGHSWGTRIAIMRGRYLIGFSNANRRAAGVATGDKVEVELALDTEPRVISEPTDLAEALDADSRARGAFDRLPFGLRRRHVTAVEDARSAETRQRRIANLVAALRGS
jgi:hypothetical protein